MDNVIFIIFLVMVILGLCCIPFIWSNWFFGEKTTIALKLKYVGAFIGGVLLVINVIYMNQQTKEQNRSNNLVSKGQLDMRFKDAAMLLASGNTSAELSAIHSLNQIAIEASQTKDQQDYVKIIKDILISFIKENSVIEYKKDENGNILLDECEYKIVDTSYNTKSKIVLQAIIDKLFRDKSCEIYDCIFDFDLTYTVLKGINFHKAQLQFANFAYAQLEYAQFIETQLELANFDNAQLQGALFCLAQLRYASFYRSQCKKTLFSHALLQDACFGEAQLQYADFTKAQIENTRFYVDTLQIIYKAAYNLDKAIFQNTFWNEQTDFRGTSFENKTIKELTKIMGNPPTPINKIKNSTIKI